MWRTCPKQGLDLGYRRVKSLTRPSPRKAGARELEGSTREQFAYSEPLCDARENPLTRPCTPEAGAREPEGSTRERFSYSEPLRDAREKPLTPTLSPQGRGEGAAHRAALKAAERVFSGICTL